MHLTVSWYDFLVPSALGRGGIARVCRRLYERVHLRLTVVIGYDCRLVLGRHHDIGYTGHPLEARLDRAGAGGAGHSAIGKDCVLPHLVDVPDRALGDLAKLAHEAERGINIGMLHGYHSLINGSWRACPWPPWSTGTDD